MRSKRTFEIPRELGVGILYRVLILLYFLHLCFVGLWDLPFNGALLESLVCDLSVHGAGHKDQLQQNSRFRTVKPDRSE